MEENKIVTVLESLGLHRNEITIYLSLLQLGKSSALELSKKTGIHRSNTYDILEQLLEKGIVDEEILNDKKYFYPIEPSDLFDYLKQKEKELEGILPEIEKMKNLKEEERKTTISEGINSAKNILMHLLDFKSEIYSLGNCNKEEEILGGFFELFHKRRIKMRIEFKAICDLESPSLIKKINSLDYSKARFIPIHEPNSTTYFCSDRIIIFLWEKPITVLTIQSKQVAEEYKKYFQFIWNSAEIE